MLSRAIYSTFKKSPLDPSMGLAPMKLNLWGMAES